ncbi:MAG: hypothetical protein O3B25_14550 [Verrucomicrobia bacterium]|nr:hypothetical protein [Verrucomicrobiota bacterium]
MKIDFRAIDKDDEELIWKIVYVTADMGKTGETIEEAKKMPIEEDMFVNGESPSTMESLQRRLLRKKH